MDLTLTETKLGDSATTAFRLKMLRDELNTMFPEREALITQLVYGLLTREHVLAFGPTGTGKSRLVKWFFGAFDDALLRSYQFTKFMPDSAVFGVPNTKLLREEGRIWHDREGTILEANFVELDELFDANDPLLRALLGVLNERVFSRGPQTERASLHSALATTNADPDKVVQRSPDLAAVIDRFILQTDVSYLKVEEGRMRMYDHYIAKSRPKTRLSYGEIAALADATEAVVIEQDLIKLHDSIVQGVRLKTNKVITDRRACVVLKLVQASAALEGRTIAEPEDFLALQWGLCLGSDEKARGEVVAIAETAITAVVKARQPDLIETQLKLLGEFTARIPNVTARTGPNNSQLPETLVTMRRTLVALQREVKLLRPGNAKVAKQRSELLDRIERAAVDCGKRIDHEAGA